MTVRDETVDPSESVLIEGLPGVGLVGKIPTDHRINQLAMRYFADVTGGELPPIALIEGRIPRSGRRSGSSPTRSTTCSRCEATWPVSAVDTPSFVAEPTAWLDELDTTPIYPSGFPDVREPEAVPTVYGVSTGDADRLLAAVDIARRSAAGRSPVPPARS